MARRVSARWLVLTVALTLGLLGQVQPAGGAGTKWTVALKSGSRGEAASLTAAPPPTGVAAACVSTTGYTIRVTWIAPAHASTYNVLVSTTSASSGFSTAPSGTGLTTTTFTSASLGAANYWYEVAAVDGSSWTSSDAVANSETTISTMTTPHCKQP
jgi:hypothetical protein